MENDNPQQKATRGELYRLGVRRWLHPQGEDAVSLILIKKPDYQVTPTQQNLTSHIGKAAVRVTTSSFDSLSGNEDVVSGVKTRQCLSQCVLLTVLRCSVLRRDQLDVIGEAALTELLSKTSISSD